MNSYYVHNMVLSLCNYAMKYRILYNILYFILHTPSFTHRILYLLQTKKPPQGLFCLCMTVCFLFLGVETQVGGYRGSKIPERSAGSRGVPIDIEYLRGDGVVIDIAG